MRSSPFIDSMLPGTLLVVALVLLHGPTSTRAHTNGLARTPPMGWRSWNLYGPNVNQSLMEHIMDGVATRKRRDHTGAMVSLCDLGYCDVGLDDNWQDCHSTKAAPGMHYHDVDGRPLVNEQRFPNLRHMADHAHRLGLTAGWYHNNCICSDHCTTTDDDDAVCDAQIRADVTALVVDFNFDSVKLDGCGDQMNLTQWDAHLTAISSRPILVENCHGGYDTPTSRDECPFHMYRSSHDIRPTYKSILQNLGTVDQFHKLNVSYPGCWAYPDMLQVGVGDGVNRGLNEAETRSHFGAWAIVSSPLILSHDVNDETVTDRIWDLISNREIIAINQAYVGDSGGRFYASPDTVVVTDLDDPKPDPIPAQQLLSKQLEDGKVAVLLMNSADEPTSLALSFDTVPGLMTQEGQMDYHIRDVWSHTDLGVFTQEWSVTVEPHDAAFVILRSAKDVFREDSETAQQ